MRQARRQRRERCQLCGQMRPTRSMLYYPSALSWICRAHTIDLAEISDEPRW